jgi:hypothetical protein
MQCGEVGKKRSKKTKEDQWPDPAMGFPEATAKAQIGAARHGTIAS